MLYYVTGNPHKINIAKKYLDPHRIAFKGKSLDIIELQSDDIEKIAISKAEQAYALLKQPLFVNDAGWSIPALQGFPGPFMRYINDWFTPDDFLRLMHTKKDRTIHFKEVFCYTDGKEIKTFSETKTGIILTKTSGGEDISRSLISLRSDGKSISQSWNEGSDPVTDYAVWQEFATWYKEKAKS